MSSRKSRQVTKAKGKHSATKINKSIRGLNIKPITSNQSTIKQYFNSLESSKSLEDSDLPSNENIDKNVEYQSNGDVLEAPKQLLKQSDPVLPEPKTATEVLYSTSTSKTSGKRRRSTKKDELKQSDPVLQEPKTATEVLASTSTSTITGRRRRSTKKDELKQSDPVSQEPNKSTEVLDSTSTSTIRGRRRRSTKTHELKQSEPVLQEPKTATEVLDSSSTSTIRGRRRRSIKQDDHELLSQTESCDESNSKIPKKDIVVTSCRDKASLVQQSEDTMDMASNVGKRKRKNIDYKGEDGSNDYIFPKASKKYNWTGNTTTALNRLFTALSSSDTGTSGPKSEINTMPKRTSVYKVGDPEKSSECMACNQIIPNLEWLEHNMTVHYNLAWRREDYPLDLSNPEFVRKTYQVVNKKQGFLRCYKCKSKFNNVDKFGTHLDICNEVVNSVGNVVCAVCKEAMKTSEWQYHKYRKHNNCAWREGDPPLNLNDQNLIYRILCGVYKQRKPLYCEKCDKQIKSVLGFLSHKSLCQLSEFEIENTKVKCPHCDRRVLPISMDCHMKSCVARKQESFAQSDMTVEPTVIPKSQRKAAKKALKSIKDIDISSTDSSELFEENCNFQEDFVIKLMKKLFSSGAQLSCVFADCGFQDNVIETLIDHLISCDKRPDQFFICKLCLLCCLESSQMNEHLVKVHKKVTKDRDDVFVEGEDENSDEEVILENKHRSRRFAANKLETARKEKPTFLLYPYGDRLKELVYAQAYLWMVDFCNKYFCINNLFKSQRNNNPWKVLDPELLEYYLPKLQESCDFSVNQVVFEKRAENSVPFFRKLELFETISSNKDETTIFCGGPVSSIAWLPLPTHHNKCNEILAVAVNNDPDKAYLISENYCEPHVIQFWDFGILDIKESRQLKPSLLFGLALVSGPIWHMEWCPSGCLDGEDGNSNRLGLLAVAASDSFVYIYCIDQPNENNRGSILSGEPVMKLQLEVVPNKEAPYYATRISWTKAKGHRYIAVGYSNGMIGLFDLVPTSPLFHRTGTSDTQLILAYSTIPAHLSFINGLTLAHYGQGNSWLFSCSADKGIIFWNLSNMSKLMSSRKYGFFEGLWLTFWPHCLMAEDENFSDAVQSHTYIKPMRDAFFREACRFTPSVSGIRSLSFSDWFNVIMQGTNAGDISGQFANRLFFNLDKKYFKRGYIRCVFSTAKLVSTSDSESSKATSTYDEAASEYRISFIDYKTENLSEIPNSRDTKLNELNLVPYTYNNYPLQAVSKVAVNPNAKACSFFAAGYQAGFVRVRNIALLKKSIPVKICEDYKFSECL